MIGMLGLLLAVNIIDVIKASIQGAKKARELKKQREEELLKK
jgi:hypothetical protein